MEKYTFRLTRFGTSPAPLYKAMNDLAAAGHTDSKIPRAEVWQLEIIARRALYQVNGSYYGGDFSHRRARGGSHTVFGEVVVKMWGG